MIRASNIRPAEHLADFRCDKHDAYRDDLDVNAGLKWGHGAVVGEEVGVGDGSAAAFQLGQDANVLVESVAVKLDGVEQERGAAYTVDESGLVTFATPPAAGTAVTADYEHDNDRALIVVPHAVLTEGSEVAECDEVSFYPTEGGSALAQELAAAKTE